MVFYRTATELARRIQGWTTLNPAGTIGWNS